MSTLGQDTMAILSNLLGYSPEKIEDLKAKGLV